MHAKQSTRPYRQTYTTREGLRVVRVVRVGVIRAESYDGKTWFYRILSEQGQWLGTIDRFSSADTALRAANTALTEGLK